MSKCRILVVDDEKTICEAVINILSGDDYIISALTSGEEVPQFLELFHVDMILMDYHMTPWTGFDTMKHLLENKTYRTIPVVFITIEEDAELERQMRQHGAVDYLHKPIDPTALRKCIEKHLNI
jgi:putative two-component system response regulator